MENWPKGLTCAAPRKYRTAGQAIAGTSQIGGLLDLEGATQQHRSKLEGTSSCTSLHPRYTCCLLQDAAHHCPCTSPNSPANKRHVYGKLDQLSCRHSTRTIDQLLHFTHHGGPKRVELIGILYVRTWSPAEGDFCLVPKMGKRRAVTRVAHCKPVPRSVNYGPSNWETRPHPKLQ